MPSSLTLTQRSCLRVENSALRAENILREALLAATESAVAAAAAAAEAAAVGVFEEEEATSRPSAVVVAVAALAPPPSPSLPRLAFLIPLASLFGGT